MRAFSGISENALLKGEQMSVFFASVLKEGISSGELRSGSKKRTGFTRHFRATALLFLFCPLLASCAADSPALSLGVGTGGVGLGLHSGYRDHDGYPYAGMYAGRRHSGVHVGVPMSSGSSRSGSPDGRIVGYEPAKPAAEENAVPADDS